MFPHLRTLSLIALMLPLMAGALATDNEKKIVLQSDSATLDHQSGITHLRGHVKLVQGTTQLSGERVDLYMNKQDQLQKAVVAGHPSHYQTQPEQGQALFFAEAKTIVYLPLEDTVRLETHAKATQRNNVFKGPQILYHIKSQRIDTPHIGNSRTTIILFPADMKKMQEQHKHANTARN